ncbi:glycophorin-C [Silurus asotus]|uniref:Glycophorin-C n=1 Tax=Silurus asotus TaxID=30991 RepID=A0AAD5FTH4_SILAS|nr:glycophorin-C [Silurus asotus]
MEIYRRHAAHFWHVGTFVLTLIQFQRTGRITDILCPSKKRLMTFPPMLLRADSMGMEPNVTVSELGNAGASQATGGAIVEDSDSTYFNVIIGETLRRFTPKVLHPDLMLPIFCSATRGDVAPVKKLSDSPPERKKKAKIASVLDSPSRAEELLKVTRAVITAVVLVFICLLFVLFRYMYRHKGTYHTNEAKGSEFAETADAALQGDPALQDLMDESKKEYFI